MAREGHALAVEAGRGGDPNTPTPAAGPATEPSTKSSEGRAVAEEALMRRHNSGT
jgi:hypothetical protein